VEAVTRLVRGRCVARVVAAFPEFGPEVAPNEPFADRPCCLSLGVKSRNGAPMPRRTSRMYTTPHSGVVLPLPGRTQWGLNGDRGNCLPGGCRIDVSRGMFLRSAVVPNRRVRGMPPPLTWLPRGPQRYCQLAIGTFDRAACTAVSRVATDPLAPAARPPTPPPICLRHLCLDLPHAGLTFTGVETARGSDAPRGGSREAGALNSGFYRSRPAAQLILYI